jgi:hypothetical protein
MSPTGHYRQAADRLTDSVLTGLVDLRLTVARRVGRF